MGYRRSLFAESRYTGEYSFGMQRISLTEI